MDGIENDLEKLLAGDIVDAGTVDTFCTPVAPLPGGAYVPIVKRTVCYIVMAWVFDEQGRVVLIQEAKQSCRGSWYIPAGRVEPGENFSDGAKREVLEEAGLEIELLTVSSIETYHSLDWYRIGYLGHVTGGKLKTLEEQDSESLQAKWFTVDEILNGFIQLRQKDFFKSLKLAQRYMSQMETARHPCYQIGIQSHVYLLLRPVVIKQTTHGIEVLCCTKNEKTRLPCCKLDPRQPSCSAALNSMFMEAFHFTRTDAPLLLPVQGLLTVEHCGIPAREHDGMCLTPVFVLPSNLHTKLDSVPNLEYKWYKITNANLSEELTRRTLAETMIIPLICDL